MTAVDTPNTQHFSKSNADYVSGFDEGHLEIPPARKLAILTCMDARLHPEKFLGLATGDAHVIRNAGGRLDPGALRSLVISQRLLGTREVAVIHHTDCGMETFGNEDLYKVVEKDLGQHAHDEATHIDFLPFKGLEQSVRTDVKLVQESELLEKVPVHGYIYDVRSGKLIPVE